MITEEMRGDYAGIVYSGPLPKLKNNLSLAERVGELLVERPGYFPDVRLGVTWENNPMALTDERRQRPARICVARRRIRGALVGCLSASRERHSAPSRKRMRPSLRPKGKKPPLYGSLKYLILNGSGSKTRTYDPRINSPCRLKVHGRPQNFGWSHKLR